MYLSPLSFTAPFVFFVISPKIPSIVPHYNRTTQLPNSKTQRPNFYSFHKRKVFPETFRSVQTTTESQQPHQNITAPHQSEWIPPCAWFQLDQQHPGSQHIRHYLQQTFWITSARSAIATTTAGNMLVAHNYKCPYSPNFIFPPTDRFRFAQGLDVFGLFATKTAIEYHKRYALPFTCLTTGAVYLEMCRDVSTAATINALRRFFCSLWNTCTSRIRQRNECCRRRQLIFKSSPLQDFLANTEIKWKYIPRHAPQFVGIWERLIRTCKDALYSFIGSQTLTDDTFATALNEIEAFLNNRPITDVPADTSDINAFTPDLFLLGRAHIKVPPGLHVWKRLIKEYLPTLLLRQRRLKCTSPLKIGQTFWILNNLTQRGFRPIGSISAINDNDTQQPRQYKIKTKTGTFTNSAIRLAPIEAEEGLHHDDDSDKDEEEEEAKIITH